VIELKTVRENPEAVRASQRARGEDPTFVDGLLAADERRRAAVTRADGLRAEQKQFGKQVGRATGEERAALLAKGKELAAEVKAAEAAQAEADSLLIQAHKRVSNVVEDGAPAGGEDDYVVLKHVGERPEFDFTPRDHVQLGEGLRAIDMERGAKVSGARFYFLTGVGAQLQLGLLTMAVNQAIEAGFTPMITPTLVRPEIMEGTGFLGAHASEVYHLPEDDLFLVGTSEVPMAAYHADEILDGSALPYRYAGWSSCFRREAGSYGKDTRGIIRVHQFDKAEMFSFCFPEDSDDEHQRLLAHEEGIWQALEIPYRVLEICAGDLAAPNYRKFDIEAWLPGTERWLEVTSCSNDIDYQARRLQIRTKRDSATELVHTLNGTAVAVGRAIVALLENHQQADGSVRIPEALQPYTGFDVIGPP